MATKYIEIKLKIDALKIDLLQQQLLLQQMWPWLWRRADAGARVWLV